MDVQRIHRTEQLPELLRPGTVLLLESAGIATDTHLVHWLGKLPESERPPVFALVSENERLDPEQEAILASRGIGLLHVSSRVAARLKKAPPSELAEEFFAVTAQLVGAPLLFKSAFPLDSSVQEDERGTLERLEQYAQVPFSLNQEDEERVDARLRGEDVGADWP